MTEKKVAAEPSLDVRRIAAVLETTVGAVVNITAMPNGVSILLFHQSEQVQVVYTFDGKREVGHRKGVTAGWKKHLDTSLKASVRLLEGA